MKILMIAYDNESFLTWFPQGLAYLATSCLERRTAGGVIGDNVEVYQQDIYHYKDEHLTAKLDNGNYDIVMVSVIGGYYQYRKLLKIANAVNNSKNRKNFKFLIGGHGPAADPKYFLEKTNADFVGIGEGEITIKELLTAIENECGYEKVDGIAYFDKDGKYVRTNPRALIQNIDEIPFPAWHLFDINYYALIRMPGIEKTDRSMSVLSGRGCTFECNFCYRLDKGFRPRSAQSIIEEVKYLKDTYNISYIVFSDELLMSSKQRTKDLCQAFIDAKLDVKWECNGRLNYADKDVLQIMKDSGCVFINYGIESLDNNTLKVMNKALTKDIITRGIENTLEIGMSPGFNIIYGNIDEPLSALDEGLEFLLKYDDHAQLRTIRPVTPYPGSPLFDYAIEKGYIKDTADFYENLHTNSDLMSVNFTKNTDDEVYAKLNEVNKKLIENYIEHQKITMNEECDNLYLNKNANFRGFRQT